MKHTIGCLYLLLLLNFTSPSQGCFSKHECREKSDVFARVEGRCLTPEQLEQVVTVEVKVPGQSLHYYYQKKTGVLMNKAYTDGFIRTFIAESLGVEGTTSATTSPITTPMAPTTTTESEEPDPARFRRDVEGKKLSGEDSCETLCRQVTLVDAGASKEKNIEYFPFFTHGLYTHHKAILLNLKQEDLKNKIKNKLGVDMVRVYAGLPSEVEQSGLTSSQIMGIIMAIIIVIIILIVIVVLCLKKMNQKKLPLMDALEEVKEDVRVRDGDIVPMNP